MRAGYEWTRSIRRPPTSSVSETTIPPARGPGEFDHSAGAQVRSHGSPECRRLAPARGGMASHVEVAPDPGC